MLKSRRTNDAEPSIIRLKKQFRAFTSLSLFLVI